MKHSLKFLLPLLAIGFFILQPASAAVITYTATGCFYTTTACDPTAVTPGSSTSFGALMYQGMPTTTVSVQPDLSASASFGTFWWSSVPGPGISNTYSGNFILLLTVTVPTPGGSSTATATVTGTISGPNGSTPAGSSVAITYPPQYQHPSGTPGGVFIENFNDPANGGTGRLGYHVQSVTVPVTALSLATGVDETGHFHETQSGVVPEPTTYALFGGGLLALGLLRRRSKA